MNEKRPPVAHLLKTWPQFFAAVREGTKTFEVRENDRDFQVGDRLILEEYVPEEKRYTGEVEGRVVTYVSKTLQDDLRDVVILGIRPLRPTDGATPPVRIPGETDGTKKVIRRTDTPESRAYWEGVEKTAKEVESWPEWKRGERRIDHLTERYEKSIEAIEAQQGREAKRLMEQAGREYARTVANEIVSVQPMDPEVTKRFAEAVSSLAERPWPTHYGRPAEACPKCKRPKWDGGHCLNEQECTRTDDEVCQLHTRILEMERAAALSYPGAVPGFWKRKVEEMEEALKRTPEGTGCIFCGLPEIGPEPKKRGHDCGCPWSEHVIDLAMMKHDLGDVITRIEKYGNDAENQAVRAFAVQILSWLRRVL